MLALGFAMLAFVYRAVAWQQMWLLASGLFFAGKTAVLRHAAGRRVQGQRDAAFSFALLWPGMNWSKWTSAAREGPSPQAVLVDGLVNIALGVLLMFVVARQVAQPLLATWVAMVGLIFLFHCGVFTILAAFWQSQGRNTKPIMRCPVAVASITEFWGKRWNLAFRDLAHTTLFMPVARRFGTTGATWVVFLVSGLAHDLVISLPAHGGYGWPTFYFLVQGIGHALEQRCQLTSALVWRLRAWLFVAVPLPLLFHAAFVLRVMHPFFIQIHALP